MASIATYSGIVRDGKIELSDKIALSEGIEVFVVVPMVIDEATARRKANGWLIDTVGNMVMADKARLVNLNGSLLWQFKAYISGSTHEPIGPIGNVFINATTGQTLHAEATAKSMMEYAKNLQRPVLASAG